MSHPNFKELFKDTADEKWKEISKEDPYKDIDNLHKGKGYTYEEWDKYITENGNKED